jgi:hypothetical protein
MQKKNPPRRHPVLWLLLALACVGLAAAIAHKRTRRAEIEGSSRVPIEEVAEAPERARVERPELTMSISTQAFSLRLDEPLNLGGSSEVSQSLLLGARTEQAPAQIIHSDPAAMLELARKSIDAAPRTNEVTLPVQGEKIVVDE